MGMMTSPRTFVYSDPHFGHEEIIRYFGRPFKSARAMDDELIKSWNDVVATEDSVFVLGDFSFLNQNKTRGIVSLLNGHKTLILGNHDRGQNIQWWKDVGFDEVSPYPIIYGGFFILSHEPVFLSDAMPYVNIHGHLHTLSYDSKQYVNVSVEKTNYRPVLLDDIISRYKDQQGNG